MRDQLTFILVRLCECDGNSTKRVAQHGNLTTNGIKQATALQRAIEEPVAVLSPDNSACRRTAEIIAGGAGFEVDAAFQEPPYPAWKDLTLDEVAKGWPSEWNSYLNPAPGDADRVLAPGGETFRATYERAREGLDRAFSRYRDRSGPIVIITHGEITRLLTVGLLGAPLENLFLVRSQNGSASRFSYDGSKAVFDTINDTCHLGELDSTDLIRLVTEG